MPPFQIISALLLGFAGSFHCLGMCGPLALSLTGRSNNPGNRFVVPILYFTGKTLTYGILGLIFGVFGQGLVLAGMQQALSIGMGSVMLLLVMISLFKASWFHQNAITNRVQEKLVPVFGVLFKKQGVFSPLLLGLLNGLLPCGLVYIGITAAVATGNAMHAVAYMLLFGLATMPVMLSFLIFTHQLGYNWRVRMRQLTPVLMALVGSVLILRGLNLGIPYISPMLDSLMLSSGGGAEAIPCHP